MQKRFIQFAGFSGAAGVALGAMAAHFLRSKLEQGLITQNDLTAFDTASKYQIYHSIALLCIALLFDKLNPHMTKRAGYCFMIGIVLFSGSLYLLATAPLMGFTGSHWLGPITPIGGMFLIAGWVLTGVAAMGRAK